MRQKHILSVSFRIFSCLLFAGLLVSCGSSKKLNTDPLYFHTGADTVTINQKETIIQSNDLLNIQVSSISINQDQAAIFNIPNGRGTETQGYQVNAAGNIKMPVIGSIKAAGLTMEQLQSQLEQKLSSYVKNPSVLVRFLKFTVNVLGEVHTPGTQKFSAEVVTVVDAISAAGDLTDYGKRQDITVIREENGKKIYHSIDLRSRNLFESPVYQLQPNDIVYVGPSNNKLKSVNLDPEKQRKTNLFISITGLIVGLAAILITILK